MYICGSPFDLFLSAAIPPFLHTCAYVRGTLPIIATLPSSETDGGKFCIDIHTEEEGGVGAGCEASTTPHIKQQPCKILNSQEKEGALEELSFFFKDANEV